MPVLFQNLADGFKTMIGAKSESSFRDISLVERYDTTPFTINNVTSFYKLISKIAAIPKSIEEISKTIISQDWKIVNKKNEKEVKKNTLPELLLQLIEQPTIDYDYREFISLAVTDLLVAGNIFPYIGQTGKNVTIRRVDPQYVYRDRGEWWENHPEGTYQPLKPAFLIHVKYMPDPYNPIWGKGIIANNITLFTNIVRMLEFRENFYKNGCFPSGAFSVENTESAGLAGESRLEKKLLDRHRGSEKAGLPLVLLGKVAYHQLQMDPTGLKVSEELTLLTKEIMSAFGLPRYLQELGLRDGGQKYNNHALQHEHFLKTTIIPIAAKLEAIYTNLAKRFNEDWEFKFDIHAEVYEEKDLLAMVDNGTMTRNEMRELMAIPKAEGENADGMDAYLVSGQLKPLEKVMQGDEGQETPFAPGGGQTNPQEPNGQQPPGAVPPPSNQPAAKPPKKPANGKPRAKSWRDDDYLSEPIDSIFTHDEYNTKATKRQLRQDFININSKTRRKKTKEQESKAKAFLMETYGRILANVAKNADAIESLSKPKKDDSKALNDIIQSVYDPKDDLIRYEKVTMPLYQAVGEATFGNTSSILTVAVPFAITDPGVASQVNLMRKDGPLVMQTTKGKLTETIQRGITDGKTHNEIAKDIWKRFVDEDNNLADEFSKIYRKGVKPKDFDAVMTKGGKLQSRSTLIARTEVARANRLFAAESMRSAEVVKTVTIINCEPGCPICGPHQNVEVSFDQAIDISNLHPNCSGTVVPGRIEVQ